MELVRKQIEVPRLRPLEQKMCDKKIGYIPNEEVTVAKIRIANSEVDLRLQEWRLVRPFSHFLATNFELFFSTIFMGSLAGLMILVIRLVDKPAKLITFPGILLILISAILAYAAFRLFVLHEEANWSEDWQIAEFSEFKEEYPGKIPPTLSPCVAAHCTNPLINFDVEWTPSGHRFLYASYYNQPNSMYCVDYWFHPHQAPREEPTAARS